MIYHPSDYYMDIHILDKDDLNQVFNIKDVLQDFHGVSDFTRSGNSLRCRCPIHGGDNPTAMAVYEDDNTCYSYTEQQRYNIFSLVDIAKNITEQPFKNAVFELCNFYNVDPETFQGIEKKERYKDKEYESKEPETLKEHIDLSKTALLLLGLKKNPFDRMSAMIGTGEYEMRPITSGKRSGQTIRVEKKKNVPITEKQASFIVYQGLNNFIRHANEILATGNGFLNHSDMHSDELMEHKNFGAFLNDAFSWYKDIASECKKIGMEDPGKEITETYMSNDNFPAFDRSSILMIGEMQSSLMDKVDIPIYPDLGLEKAIDIFTTGDVLVQGDKAYCPTLEEYLTHNLSLEEAYMDEIECFRRQLTHFVLPFCTEKKSLSKDMSYLSMILREEDSSMNIIHAHTLDLLRNDVWNKDNEKESVIEETEEEEMLLAPEEEQEEKEP